MIVSGAIIIILLIAAIVSRVYQTRLQQMVKKKTSELRESEEKYRKLYESSQDAILLMDKKRFIHCNQATLDLFKISSVAEFLKITPGKLLPSYQPDGNISSKLYQAKISEAFSRGKARFYWVYCKMSGDDFHADVIFTKIDLGGRDVILVAIRDITERKNPRLRSGSLMNYGKSLWK